MNGAWLLRLSWGFCVAAMLLGACQKQEDGSYQGYVEGEYVYVSSPFAGELIELHVRRGDTVEAEAALFELDPNPQALEATQVEERMAEARARLDDLRTGSRPSELAAIEARLQSAQAGLQLAESDYERRRELYDAGHTDAVSDEELDRYRTDRDVRRADVATLAAELETARLGGRADAVAAAESQVGAIDASLQELNWQIDEKRAAAPAGGLVQDTLYRLGEFVPAGRPVVSLLPPENRKVRFFVPEAALSTLRIGAGVRLQVDGHAQAIAAEIAFISPEAEFTPPVIYSKETRTKLVFMIEARPEPSAALALHPGQPLDVYLD